MAKLIPSEKIPPELLSKVNIVKKRILFLSPSVASGHEREPRKDDFEALTNQSIGTGGFGKVYKVKHKVSKNVYAIKVISKEKIIEQNMHEQIKLEVRIMYSLNHEHVIKLYNHFEDDDFFYLVLEYAPKGHLYEKLKNEKRFLESDAAQYLREVISAVQYLHSLNPPIIHRDIKPENILLDAKDAAKLCDFGWSNFFGSDRVRMTYCGTPDYLSPEMIRQEGHDQRLDIWNIGVLLFEMLTGKPPFYGATQRELLDNILKLKINYPKDFPKLARDLVSKLLKPNPKDRISLKEMTDHPWLKSKPLLRPVLTKEIRMDVSLPTVDQDLEEREYEPVSKVSKINREEERKSSILSISGLDQELPADLKMRNEKDDLIDTLHEQLEKEKKEANEQKVQLESLASELKAVKQENEEIKKYFGDTGYMSTDKVEIRKLSEELNKLKAINKNREEVIQELDKTKEALTEALTKNKILTNEMEALHGVKQSLEDKTAELQGKLDSLDKKYAALKHQFEETNFSKEKSTAELEAKIDELQYKLPAKTLTEQPTESPETAILEVMEYCKKALNDIRERVKDEIKYKKSEEQVRYDLNNEHVKLNDLKSKYESEIYEYEQAIAKSIEEIRRKCDTEKRDEVDKKDKTIEDLSLQLAQVEMQEGRTAVEANHIKLLQIQNVQLQKALNDLRVQVTLYSKEQKHLKEMINAKNTKIQDLEYQMEQEKERTATTVKSSIHI